MQERHNHAGGHFWLWLVIGALLLVLWQWFEPLWRMVWHAPDMAQIVQVVVEEQGGEWIYRYQHGGVPNMVLRPAEVRAAELLLPAGKPAQLEFRINSLPLLWRLPARGLQIEVQPGIAAQLTWPPDAPGRYQVVCGQPCTTRPAVRVRVMAAQEWQGWMLQHGVRP